MRAGRMCAGLHHYAATATAEQVLLREQILVL
jgi:hypothetical protein